MLDMFGLVKFDNIELDLSTVLVEPPYLYGCVNGHSGRMWGEMKVKKICCRCYDELGIQVRWLLQPENAVSQANFVPKKSLDLRI